MELLGRFLSHFKESGDPTILRVSALRHGDKSLLTMLSAFVPPEEVERCNYLTMSPSHLDKLSIRKFEIERAHVLFISNIIIRSYADCEGNGC